MRMRIGVALVVAVAATCGVVPAAKADTISELLGVTASPKVQVLRAPAPAFMRSAKIRHRIDRAGAEGVSLTTIRRWVHSGLAGRKAKDEPVPDPCPTEEPGTEAGSVHANACITYPYGCTANFIYHRATVPYTGTSDGRNDFIGTAGHCADHSGQPVYMDDGAGNMIRAGEVWKHVNGGIGNDFAAVKVDKGLKLDATMPGEGGPDGIYSACEGGQSLTWWGHGYEVAVGQGQQKQGILAQWWNNPYGWNGAAFGGDSGSGVEIQDDHVAAGNLTHLVVDSKYPGSTVAGTRLTRILYLLGGNVRLVGGDDHTLYDAPRDTNCGNPSNG